MTQRSRSRPALALLLIVVALTALRPPPAAASDATRGVARVQLVGDSLSHAVADWFPADWRVRARNGRALFDSLEVIALARSRSPECVVLALGSNDVGRRRTRAQMVHDLDEAHRILAGVPCVAWTTVKVDGVSRGYGSSWPRYARMWNALVQDHVEDIVLDWNSVARSHPGYFLGDGLHLSSTGRVAYVNLLRRGVGS